MEVRVLRDGNLISVKPITPDIARVLESELHYVRMVQIRGYENIEAAGGKRQRFDHIDLYRYDANGRLLTNFGFKERVCKALAAANYQVVYKDLRPRTEAQNARLKPLRKRLKRFEFRYRQDEVIEHVLNEERGVFVCPTGYGKSFLVRVLATILPFAKIHVITQSADVIRDYYNDLRVVLPDVGLQGAGQRSNGHRVQMYCAGSLNHSAFDADIVLVDEGHELATDNYMPQLAKYRYSKMFMFTASYEMRLDKADRELEGLFGPVRVRVSYQEGVDHKMIVPIRVRWVPVMMSEDPAEDLEGTAKERAAIWRNKTRNKLIRDAARAFGDDEQVLIVCEKVEHVALLKKLLPEFTMCYGENGMSADQRFQFIGWKCFDDNEPYMTPERREHLKKKFESGKLKKVIATSVWNRGVNFHQLSVLIRADGSGRAINDVQIPGRVSRLSTGKNEGLIIDFMDQFNKTYKGRAADRRKNYRANNWTQEFPEAKGFRQYLMF